MWLRTSTFVVERGNQWFSNRVAAQKRKFGTLLFWNENWRVFEKGLIQSSMSSGASRKSPAWEHMTRNGNSAVCSRCKKVVKLGKNGTTSNALRHLRSAHQLNVELEAALTRQKLVKRLLCRFVIMELLPIKAVISPSMKRLLSTLDPKLTTPSYYSITKTLNIISTQVENTVCTI